MPLATDTKTAPLDKVNHNGDNTSTGRHGCMTKRGEKLAPLSAPTALVALEDESEVGNASPTS